MMMMSSGESSCSPSKMNAILIKVLAFDFDKTCTKKAVLDIYKARDDYKNGGEDKAKILDKEWEKLETFYVTLLQKIMNPLKEAKAMPPRFDEDGLRRFLKEVQVIDTTAVDEVIKSKILKGVTTAGIRDFAQRVQLMPDLLNVLQSLKILNLRMQVISLNFSKKLIENVLSCGGALPLDVHTNHLEFENEICTGNMDKRFLSAFDKELLFQKIVQSADKNCGVSIYIGDSFTDLLVLVKADIGLIIGNSKSMLKVCNDFGIRVVPLHEWSYAKFVGKDNTELQQVLFSVQSWEQIKNFMLTFEHKPGEKSSSIPE